MTQPTTNPRRTDEANRRPYPQRKEERGPKRKLSGPALVSIVLHVVIGAALVRVLMIPYPFESLFETREKPVQPERITFLALPQSESAPETPGRSGGNGRPETPQRKPAPPIVAPTEVPSSVPPPSSAAPPAPAPGGGEGTGPVIGGGGPTRGVRPSYSDPRIWVPEAPVVSAPKSAHARMDSAVASAVEHARDSIAANTYTPNKFERGDWTVEKGGRKYGIDKEYVRLGPVSIPLPLLALLPLNAQGNPIAAQRDKELASLRAEIQYQSQRALNEQEFRKAVKSLRERKERERQQQEKERQQATPQPEPSRSGSPLP